MPDRLQALAAAQGRTGSVIEIQALQAVALAAAGDQDGAVAALAETLTLAHPRATFGSSPTRARQ